MTSPHLTKINLTPNDVVNTNLTFLSDSEYDVVETKLKTRKRIKRESEDDLQRAIDEFPYDEPLHDQCAYWMHAFAGKHFFPDANHRTALATLRATLRENGIEVDNIPRKKTVETIKESKRIRRNLDIDMGSLYNEDEMYELWKDYFEEVV